MSGDYKRLCMALIGEEKAPVPGEKKKKKGNIDVFQELFSRICDHFSRHKVDNMN